METLREHLNGTLASNTGYEYMKVSDFLPTYAALFIDLSEQLLTS